MTPRDDGRRVVVEINVNDKQHRNGLMSQLWVNIGGPARWRVVDVRGDLLVLESCSIDAMGADAWVNQMRHPHKEQIIAYLMGVAVGAAS